MSSNLIRNVHTRRKFSVMSTKKGFWDRLPQLSFHRMEQLNEQSESTGLTASTPHAVPELQTDKSVAIEQVIEHSDTANGATQEVLYVGVREFVESSSGSGTPVRPITEAEQLELSSSAYEFLPPSISDVMQSLMLPSRIMMSALRIPFKVALKGKRRPTWSTEMEMVISGFRSACRNAPRDLTLIRAWTDVEIPSMLLPKGARVRETSLHGMRVEWVFPHALHGSSDMLTNADILTWSKTHPVVLYLHGGGHALCGTNTHRNIFASFAVEDVVLCAPNYRRPPEVSIIDATDDCFAMYMHLIEVIRIDPKHIAIMGDSAGGALAVLTLGRIRDTGTRMPTCGVLLSPWVELDDADIAAEAAKGNMMPAHDYLPRDALIMISKLVCGNLSPKDPRINPMNADVTGLPPILIHVGELELLFDQITRFYEKLRECGVETKMKIWIDGVHVPHVFTMFSEESKIAVKDAANYIKLKTHPQSFI